MSFPQDQVNGESEYYKDLSDNLIIKPYIAFTAADYIIFYNDAGGNSNKITYHTLEKENDGISLSWKDYGISAGISRVVSDKYEDKKSKHEISYDFRLNSMGRRICFDFYYQKQNGLFFDPFFSKKQNTPFIYIDSMDLMIFSANLYYNFSWKTFSLRSAYEAIDLQKRSAGSFLLMMNSGIVTIRDRSSILREEIISVEERMKGLKECSSEHISISPGYSRTFVFFDDFFFNFLFFYGIGADQTVYSVETGTITQQKFYPRVNIRLALGYSDEKFFCGISLNIDEQTSSLNNQIPSLSKNLDTSLMLYDSKIYAGYRFSI